ncbi:hypothetical protein GHV40_01100 [Devosia sp. D6-9]|nr:hypothetical protein GHV40_01100 [Devosia sp. D6-9]
MSLWQYFAALNGYVAANTPKDTKKLSDQEADDLFSWIEEGNLGRRSLSTQTYSWDERGPLPAGIVFFEVG